VHSVFGFFRVWRFEVKSVFELLFILLCEDLTEKIIGTCINRSGDAIPETSTGQLCANIAAEL
jgi:hypothetical protein